MGEGGNGGRGPWVQEGGGKRGVGGWRGALRVGVKGVKGVKEMRGLRR